MPSMICTGPDRALWVTLNQAGAIARCTTAGEITTYALPTPGAALVPGDLLGDASQLDLARDLGELSERISGR